MIVLDASAAVEFLLNSTKGRAIQSRILPRKESIHAPHLLDLEVASALRKAVLRKLLSVSRAEEALEDFQAVPIKRYPHNLLLDRVWDLRSALTPYDACYVSLAEALRAPLVTCDSRLAKSGIAKSLVELY